MSRFIPSTLFAVGVAIACWSCGSGTNTTTTPTPTPTQSTLPEQTLNKGGAVTIQPVTTSGAGTVTLQVQTIAPDSTAVIGIALGTWNGNQCTLIVTKDDATTNSSIQGTVNGATNLCVRISDPTGNLPSPSETITLLITKP